MDDEVTQSGMDSQTHATDAPEQTAVEPERRWAWLAAIVGVLAVVLILYGRYVQPRLLPNRYAGHLQQASHEFDLAVSPENPHRTVEQTLIALRKTRIAYQRLAALRPEDRELRWSHGRFALDAADELARWLHQDRGYLRAEEREQIGVRTAELHAEAIGLLRGLLSQQDKLATDAAILLLEWALTRAGDASVVPIVDSVDAFAADLGNRELDALIAAARMAIAGTLPRLIPGEDDAFHRDLESLEGSDRPLLVASRVLLKLRSDPSEAYNESLRHLDAGRYR